MAVGSNGWQWVAVGGSGWDRGAFTCTGCPSGWEQAEKMLVTFPLALKTS